MTTTHNIESIKKQLRKLTTLIETKTLSHDIELTATQTIQHMCDVLDELSTSEDSSSDSAKDTSK